MASLEIISLLIVCKCMLFILYDVFSEINYYISYVYAIKYAKIKTDDAITYQTMAHMCVRIAYM